MLKYLPLNVIEVPEVKLRGIRTDDPDFQDLLLSIQEHGVLEPILVRPLGDDRYSLVNGLQRYACAQKCELDVIPARIDEGISDATDALLKSVITNLHRVKTRPYEYANCLRLYIRREGDLTIADLAKRLGKSTTWVVDRLALTNLSGPIGKLLDEGGISVKKSQGLAMLPPEEQQEVLDSANDMRANEFYDLCLERKRAGQVALRKRSWNERREKAFTGHPVLRKRAVVVTELETNKAGKKMLSKLGEITPLEAWHLAIAWSVQMDPQSLEEREKAYDSRVQFIKARNKEIGKDSKK